MNLRGAPGLLGRLYRSYRVFAAHILDGIEDARWEFAQLPDPPLSPPRDVIVEPAEQKPLGPYRRLAETQDDMRPVVGARNPRLTMRVSSGNTGRLDPKPQPWLNGRHEGGMGELPDYAVRPGQFVECSRCDALVPPEDLAHHGCEDGGRANLGAGSQDFATALKHRRLAGDPDRSPDDG